MEEGSIKNYIELYELTKSGYADEMEGIRQLEEKASRYMSVIDLPPKNRSTLKLENFILWIKGGSNERTKANGGRDHQQTARSRGFAGEGNVYRRSNASVGGERCNVLQVAEGVWRAESGPGEAIEGVGG